MDACTDSDPAGSTLPLYHRLAARLESAIRAGRISRNDGLGNEVQLAARFGVSRTTMRRAILQLVDKGLLVRRRGVGTYVVHSSTTGFQPADKPITRELRLNGLFDDLIELDLQPATVVLTRETIRPPQAVVKALDLSPGRLTLHLRRVRYAGSHPLAILENYLPADIAALDAFDPSTTGLYRTLRGQGISLRVAKERIGARNGTESECLLLDEPVDSPLLTMDRTTHDSNGRVVEVASHLYRASRHEYTMTLVDRW